MSGLLIKQRMGARRAREGFWLDDGPGRLDQASLALRERNRASRRYIRTHGWKGFNMALTYTLIGTPFSAATIKARLLLRWANAPMMEKAATVAVVQSYIKPRLKTIATPLIVSSDQAAFTDTRAFIDALGRDHAVHALRPKTPAQGFTNDLLEAWADNDFSRQAEYVYWVCERDQAKASLAEFLEREAPREQAERRAHLVSVQIGKRFADDGFDKHSNDAVKAELAANLERLDKALGESAYLFGDRPATSEFALAGALHVLASTSIGADMLAAYPRLAAWRMRLTAVDGLAQGEHRRVSSCPSAFMQLMRHAAQEFVPRALGCASAVADWAEANPGIRALPDQIRLGGGRQRPSRRKSQSRPAWRTREAYWLSHLGERARPRHGVENAELYRFLKMVGLLPLREFVPPRELIFQNHRLEFTLRDVHAEPDHASLLNVESALMKARQSSADIAELTAIHV